MIFNSLIFKKRAIYFFLALLFCFFCFSGCGENLFGTKEKKADTIEEMFDNASSVADYTKILDHVTKIIDNPDSSTTEKAEAYAGKGEAIIGQTGLFPSEIFSNVSALSSDNGGDNIFNIIDIESVSLDDLTDSATAFNESNNLKPSQLTDSQQLNRGVMNTLVVVKKVDNVFDLDSEGEIAEGKGGFNALENLIAPSSGLTLQESVDTSSAAFDEAAVFSSDQKVEVDKIKDSVAEMQTVYQAANTGGTYRGITFSSADNDDTKNAKVNQALELVFTGL